MERSYAGRSVVIRRWGWSDDSDAAALRHAESRALEAFQHVSRGESVPRRERKTAYNGAAGTPIREEIVDRVGTAVVTRNGYGALCLNTPDVLFADIDLDTAPPGKLSCLLVLVFVAAAFWSTSRWGVGWVLVAAGVVWGLIRGLSFARDLHRSAVAVRGGFEQVALGRIQAFITSHPEWGVRVYRTPAGLRVLATHAPLDPRGDEATALFEAVRADPVFVAMCRNQNCFRARLTPKPWRIGVDFHGWNGRRLVWPIPEDRLAARREWVERYNEASQEFAACEFLVTLGNGDTHPAAREIVHHHDAACRSDSGLPLA